MRLIDADALMKTLGITDMDCGKCKWGDHGYCTRGSSFTDACTAIEDAPTIEERKKGKWRYSRNISSISYSDMMITCDQCGYTKERSHGDVFNFCPSCGASMHELETESRDYENKGDDD